MRAILALGAMVVSTAAMAQSVQNQGAGPDNGFFRPTPGNDPSLHAPVVPAPVVPTAQTQPQPQPAAQPVSVPVYVPVQVATPPRAEVSVAEARAQQAKASEQELDRAQREAAEAQQRARQQPAPINGAFTGLTSERDR